MAEQNFDTLACSPEEEKPSTLFLLRALVMTTLCCASVSLPFISKIAKELLKRHCIKSEFGRHASS